jgi:hypothetical protein
MREGINQQKGYEVKSEFMLKEAMNEIRILKDENIMLKACISQMNNEKLAELNAIQNKEKEAVQ